MRVGVGVGVEVGGRRASSLKGISSRTEKVKNVQIFPFTDKIGLFSQYLRNKKFFFSSLFFFFFVCFSFASTWPYWFVLFANEEQRKVGS